MKEILIILCLASFLIGSIPTGLIIAKLKGVDLRAIGSGNIGATNVLRAMGKEAAIITLIGDIVKGTIPVLLARHILSSSDIGIAPLVHIDSFITEPKILAEGVVGLFAVLGHNYSIFLKFRGGKGVATSLGMLLPLSPHSALIAITIWLFALARSGYSSLSSLVAFGTLPIVIFIVDRSNEKILITAFIAVLIFLRHVSNIKRLLAGTENKIFKK